MVHSTKGSSELIKLGVILWVLFIVYAIVSYLIFLRDDFILERIALLSDVPWLLGSGRRWGKTLHVNSLPTPLLFVTLTAMYAIYAKTLSLLRKTKLPTADGIKIVLTWSAMFLITTLLSFPSLSTDVFDYIASNRVLFVHQANPWLVAPQNFPEDEFIWLGSWRFRASVYGPVQFLFSSAVHLLAGESIIGNLVGFKIEAALVSLALILLVKKWLGRFAPKNLVYGLAVIAWNPLLYIEVVGNAHNDVIMAFFATLGLYLLMLRKISLSAFAISMATLAKVASALYLLPMTVWLARGKDRSRAAAFTGLCIAFIGLGLATLGDGLAGFISNLGVQFGLYLRSLPTIVRFTFLRLGYSETQAMHVEKLLTIPPFMVIIVHTIRKLGRTALLPSLVMIMLGYLLIASPMLQPWYLIWVLPFIALLPPGRLQAGALVLTWSALLHYIVLFVSFYFSPLNFLWQVAMYLVIVIPPLLVWLSPQSWYTALRRNV